MHLFKDSAGADWKLLLNVGSFKAVRAATQVDFYALVDDGFKPLHLLLSDPAKFVDVLYVLCRDECKERGINDEGFGRLFDGDTLERATDAFVEGLIDFFPPGRRAHLREALGQMKALESELLGQMTENFKKVDLVKAASDMLDKLRRSVEKTSPPPSGDAPAHSE